MPADLLAEFERTDRRTRALLRGLEEDQLVVPYRRGINPPLWELGHAAFFTEYFFLRVAGDREARMPGYDEIWDSFQIPHEVRWRDGEVPGAERAWAYYDKVCAETRALLSSDALSPHHKYLARYAIAHQNMHIESLIWCRQTLGYPPPPDARDAAACDPMASDTPSSLGDAEIDGGRYTMGVAADGDAFGFDAEKPGFATAIAPFAISKTLVTNEEFRAFIAAGGYGERGLWSYAGWCWREVENAEHPLYWRRTDGGGWESRWFDRWSEPNPHAPILHVNFYEAEAFANWAGRRLPTEYEWEAAARGAEGRRFPWGDTMDAARVDMDGTSLARDSVAARVKGATPQDCRQMIGTAWEWTTDQFLPYDGFKVDMYPYMSTLQFGDHKVAKGGSCATSSSLIRASYRQAYLPQRRDVFVGFRTCRR